MSRRGELDIPTGMYPVFCRDCYCEFAYAPRENVKALCKLCAHIIELPEMQPFLKKGDE